MAVDILLITPPFTQLNTPYPATAYLKGFLNQQNYTSFQSDIGLEVILEMFSRKGLQNIFDYAKDRLKSENAKRIFALQSYYISVIDEVILFLQGKNPNLAMQICQGGYLPQASRFEAVEAFESSMISDGPDKAKHLATLFLEDLSDFIIENIDSNFGFSRYGEKLGRCANTFDDIYYMLNQELSFVDKITVQVLEKLILTHQPKAIAITIPFPGNLLGAFRCGQYCKNNFPDIKIAFGGGFVSTELRSVTDVRVFEFVDYLCLDRGELPIECIIKNNLNPSIEPYLKRTFILENAQVSIKNTCESSDYKIDEIGTPDYTDLKLDKYISVLEITNAMHRLWSDGRWNKLTLAEGCYWSQCTFCDISLDYIKNYAPQAVAHLVDQVIEIKAKTGESGFHFVDEAAPPAILRDFALELLKRNVQITWWTNIRFEKSFTADLCGLLRASGCIAISGGLEVASDRLLQLIKKGVTVEQVAKVCCNFTESGIMVHAYLMYGFPSQTIQETVDSLEMVRQMFALGIVNSAFWHRFALTRHSPILKNFEKYNIKINEKKIEFADNDVDFEDKTQINHEAFSYGLKKSLYNYMHGNCLENDLQEWFDFKIPNTKIKSDFIENSIVNSENAKVNKHSKIVWLGVDPSLGIEFKRIDDEFSKMIVLDKMECDEIVLDNLMIESMKTFLAMVYYYSNKIYTYGELVMIFKNENKNFEEFWQQSAVKSLLNLGLLIL